MEKVTHAMRREYWANIIQECNQSGMLKKDWLAIKGINPKSFYTWQRKLRMEMGTDMILSGSSLPAAAEQPQFSLMTPPISDNSPACNTAVIHIKDIRVEVNDKMSDEFLFRILKVISHV